MLPAVAIDPATPMLPAVAIDPATAMLPEVATAPATAMLAIVASDPATATLSLVGGESMTAAEAWVTIGQSLRVSDQGAPRWAREAPVVFNWDDGEIQGGAR